jgi:hypothetical protein
MVLFPFIFEELKGFLKDWKRADISWGRFLLNGNHVEWKGKGVCRKFIGHEGREYIDGQMNRHDAQNDEMEK